jgi:hypothetical protein
MIAGDRRLRWLAGVDGKAADRRALVSDGDGGAAATRGRGRSERRRSAPARTTAARHDSLVERRRWLQRPGAPPRWRSSVGGKR